MSDFYLTASIGLLNKIDSGGSFFFFSYQELLLSQGLLAPLEDPDGPSKANIFSLPQLAIVSSPSIWASVLRNVISRLDVWRPFFNTLPYVLLFPIWQQHSLVLVHLEGLQIDGLVYCSSSWQDCSYMVLNEWVQTLSIYFFPLKSQRSSSPCEPVLSTTSLNLTRRRLQSSSRSSVVHLKCPLPFCSFPGLKRKTFHI